MALLLTLKCWCLSLALFFIASSFCSSEENPVQIVDKALLCFNNRMIYADCEESYRLTATGNIDVPHEATDAYCNGPCLDETKLLLNCIEGVLSNFFFYNKATIQDVRTTVDAACSDSSERGNFDVSSHIQSELSHAQKIGFLTYTYACMAMILAGRLLF